MSIIKLLPDHLINKIAAGEVVERPASVIKECVENSIDANATRIDIHIQNAGKTEMQIIDDGEGMSEEDAALAFKRHATSKISTADDLARITSMGFRGEALASIGAVCRVTLETKIEGSDVGTRITCENETITETGAHGCPKGTSITIRDLFFNMPARKKYLKTDATEMNHNILIATELALAHPEIHFKLTHNWRTIFDLPKSSRHDRIRKLFGKNISDHLIPIFYGGKNVQIKGFIGKPEIARNSRLHQYFFINHRAIKNNALAYAVSEGFHALLPHKKYPIFFVHLTIDPELIDVNVHPRKLEIRFQNQNEMFNIVKKAVKQSLEKHVLAPKISWEPSRISDGFDPVRRMNETVLKRETKAHTFPPFSQKSVHQALKFTQDIARHTAIFDEERMRAAPIIEENFSMQPITQIADSYILATDEEGIIIIDQHAAHERCMYTMLMKEYEKKSPARQQLLIPLSLELSHREIQMLETSREILKNLGFEMEKFTGKSFNVTAIPACLKNEDIGEILAGVIDDLIQDQPGKNTREIQEKVITYTACRSAIKFGKSLTHEEQVALIRQMDSLDQKYTCPHGRPTMIRLTLDELEKKFGRK